MAKVKGRQNVMVYMPEDAYEALRLKAYEERVSMSQELVDAWVRANRAWVRKAAKRQPR